MIILLDNTVLSNFVLIHRADLLRHIPQTATTEQVVTEFKRGQQLGRLPIGDLSWLPILTLTEAEQVTYIQFLTKLNSGEAACLAIAVHRQGAIFTDDRDARILANQSTVPVSGTLGILIRLVKLNILALTEAETILNHMIGYGYHSPTNTLSKFM
jgi:predicted nucleic acid-binding protein